MKKMLYVVAAAAMVTAAIAGAKESECVFQKGMIKVKDADGKTINVGLVHCGMEPLYGGIARFGADGKLDTTFNYPFGFVKFYHSTYDQTDRLTGSCAVRIQPDDGKILVAGPSTTSMDMDSVPLALVRYNKNGSLDTSFASSGIVLTNPYGWDIPLDEGGSRLKALRFDDSSISITNDGKISVSADATFDVEGGTEVERYTVHYTANGALDASFGSKVEDRKFVRWSYKAPLE